MPVSKLQSSILKLIASKRDPESFVAGGVPINRSGPRYSADLDIFHDRAERVASAALTDAKTLADAGFDVNWIRQQPATYSASIKFGDEETKLEWVADSDYRFFPIIEDDQFGYVLHIIDIAINKVMAAASRREARDFVDVLTLHENVLSIGALVWAAADIAPGYTPEGLIEEIRRNARHPKSEFEQLAADPPIDANAVFKTLRAALEQAEAFVAAMPSSKSGAIFFDQGIVVEPDPKQLDRYLVHSPTRRGHWPCNPEITEAMLERLKSPRF